MPRLLDLLSELVPQASKIALLANPNNPVTKQIVRSALDAAQVRGMTLSVHSAGSEVEIDSAFASLAREPVSGVLVEEEPFLDERNQQIAALASRNAIPAIFGANYATGGLFSYAADVSDLYRNAGIHVGRILKGARPADLPVQQPTLYRLVVNLKVARTLGLTVPQSILVRADEVVE
jgi:putative tryptophan/tyrosine transport system substrate-binding protein